MRNPSGLCKCGCGRKTNIAPQKDDGYVKGEHFEYLRGHSRTAPIRKPVRYVEEDRGHESACWIWQLAKTPEGYGKLTAKGKTRYAHRIYYEEIHGPVEAGFQLDHLCRVRDCVNPDHMEPVTPLTNVHRSSKPKIPVELVKELRERVAGGAQMTATARELGIPHFNLTALLSGRLYPHAGGPLREPQGR